MSGSGGNGRPLVYGQTSEASTPRTDALRGASGGKASGFPADRHRYDPGRGIVCGSCRGTIGVFGPEPRSWTCGACRLHAPVDDMDLIPGMTAPEPAATLDDLADNALLDLNALAPPGDSSPLLEMVRRYGDLRLNLDLFPTENNAAEVREQIDLIEARINLARAESYQRGVAAGRREAFEYELAQSEGCAAALDTLPGQQQAAAFYRLHAEHIRAVLAQEGADRD